MEGMDIMLLGLILNALFAVLAIFNEDLVFGIAFGMFVVAVGAVKFGKEEGLI